jgi:hypothetical protein
MIGILGLSLPIIIAAPWMITLHLRSRNLVERWGDRLGYRLILVERRWFALGPFLRLPLRGPVFRIIVNGGDGRSRSGFVLANPSFPTPIEVQWD